MLANHNTDTPRMTLRSRRPNSMWNTSVLLIVCAFFTRASMANAPDFQQTLADINTVMHQYHYSPKELKSADYKTMQVKMQTLADTATSKKAFIQGFNRLWQEGPFSHVRIDEARQSADALAEHLDNLNVGGTGAVLTWQDQIAVLTVNTMMGQDTIQQIAAAYNDIEKKQASALIIDVRNNNGGAFAVKPLVSHLTNAPLDAGAFVSQPWNAKYDRPPNQTDMQKVPGWQGWSIRAFWNDAQNNAITRIQFEPAKPHFTGKVYVLTSNTTASAAELAVDALLGLPNVTVIGETTAGQMLSQKMYDIEGQLQLFVPIADYYAVNSGRIEGKGVTPHIAVPAEQAMDAALAKINQ